MWLRFIIIIIVVSVIRVILIAVHLYDTVTIASEACLNEMLCLHSDVSVEVPDEIDISHIRGSGKQPGEEELPEPESETSGFVFTLNVLI